ncbi:MULTISPECIES: globin family protein [unclassified Rhizobium]|uniref:globin family protein n=1 Tax=unclassified Rhizobium TaxID=2613769 RepID=UPI0006FEEAC3|nr:MULTISPECIES: globin family protein [unclassified Rhizobium]KQV43964.1 hemin receptor [Rhizobium sp. Root1212]KRD38145.1 hemin receptor [Rhizobium sp. Root268]
MDDRKIELLETTFAEVRASQDAAAALFYERLFVNDPSLRRLFNTSDMAAQGRKLMAALALAVHSLRKLDALVPVLEGLAVKHVGYGVEPAHYDTVGTALIETLSLSFGERFTAEVRAAWTETYQLVAGVMMRAAYGQAAA